jgi:hypothetical protein
VLRVSGTTLDWQFISFVLGSVACDGFQVTIISLNGDPKPDHCITRLDQLQVIITYSCLGSCSVEEKLHLLEETRLYGWNLSGRSFNGRCRESFECYNYSILISY